MHTGNAKVVDEIIRIALYLCGTDIGCWALRSSETVEIIFLENIIYVVSTDSASQGMSKSMPLQGWSTGQQHGCHPRTYSKIDAQAPPMPSYGDLQDGTRNLCCNTFCDSGSQCSPRVTSAGLNLTAYFCCFKNIFYHGIIINCHDFSLK